jgi:glutamate synthase domain-containing protein 2
MTDVTTTEAPENLSSRLQSSAFSWGAPVAATVASLADGLILTTGIQGSPRREPSR